MKVRLLVVAALAALAVPSVAAGKGPSQATISGPGLDKPIVLESGGGDPSAGTPLGTLTEQAGFFPAVFGQQPDPMLRRKPDGQLGRRFRVVYRVPGPNNETSTIRQDLYPYAKPYPVSYTAPGQRFWGDQKTYGGWFIGLQTLKSTLVGNGLRATPRTGGGGSGLDVPAWAWAIVGVGGALVLAGVAAALASRRGPSTAPAG
jgi:hypothetical protein